MMTTQCQAPGANGKRNRDDNNNCQQREKRAELSSTLMDFDNNNHNDKEKEERVQHKIGSTAKDRVWTPELHLKFTEAIAVLGDQSTVLFPIKTYIEFISFSFLLFSLITTISYGLYIISDKVITNLMSVLCFLLYSEASPKTILHVMNVPRLTTRQVASHMQVLFYYFNLRHTIVSINVC